MKPQKDTSFVTSEALSHCMSFYDVRFGLCESQKQGIEKSNNSNKKSSGMLYFTHMPGDHRITITITVSK
jgi:hypothetical protein